MNRVMKIILGLMIVSVVVNAKTNDVDRTVMIPEGNPQLRAAQKETVERVLNIEQIPQISAVDARLMVDGNGNIVAMAMVNPVEASSQAQNGTLWERTKEHFSNNWQRYAIGTASLVVVDRVAANNNWLWHDWFGSSSGDTGRDSTGANMTVSNQGDGNTFNINNYQVQGEGSVSDPESSAGSPVDNSDNSTVTN